MQDNKNSQKQPSIHELFKQIKEGKVITVSNGKSTMEISNVEDLIQVIGAKRLLNLLESASNDQNSTDPDIQCCNEYFSQIVDYLSKNRLPLIEEFAMGKPEIFSEILQKFTKTHPDSVKSLVNIQNTLDIAYMFESISNGKQLEMQDRTIKNIHEAVKAIGAERLFNLIERANGQKRNNYSDTMYYTTYTSEIFGYLLAERLEKLKTFSVGKEEMLNKIYETLNLGKMEAKAINNLIKIQHEKDQKDHIPGMTTFKGNNVCRLQTDTINKELSPESMMILLHEGRVKTINLKGWKDNQVSKLIEKFPSKLSSDQAKSLNDNLKKELISSLLIQSFNSRDTSNYSTKDEEFESFKNKFNKTPLLKDDKSLRQCFEALYFANKGGAVSKLNLQELQAQRTWGEYGKSFNTSMTMGSAKGGYNSFIKNQMNHLNKSKSKDLNKSKNKEQNSSIGFYM